MKILPVKSYQQIDHESMLTGIFEDRTVDVQTILKLLKAETLELS